ncbi:MAG: Hsp70 family protein [Acidobacteriia bacterium]|nr:Hsp70 family protein [Terriglobia bacterium]
MNALALGIDFGTTNSSIARANASGKVDLAQFPASAGVVESYRSLLYLDRVLEKGVTRIKSWSGPAAIDEYLAADTKGRLVQSLKSYLSSRGLKGTEVFGRRITLETLIARILRDLREKVEDQFGGKVETAVVGRPVRFVGADHDEDDHFAEERLQHAFHEAGYPRVKFEFEPVAAAQYYESTLNHEELILIGDFGGGTSDFSLLRVGPELRRRGRTPKDLLGNSGVGIAGDAFDAKLVRNLVSPALGRGSSARSLKKVLPAVPNWVYAKLEHWHHLSFLRTGSTMNLLNSSRAAAFEPDKIEALIHLIREDLGYELHRAVQKTKCALSVNPAANFHFSDGVIEIEAEVERGEFEEWIAEELARIEACVDSLIEASGVSCRDVDMVFLTGGSSFVPAVRRIFETRFGAQRIRTGNEFTSVARGLALKAVQIT